MPRSRLTPSEQHAQDRCASSQRVADKALRLLAEGSVVPDTDAPPRLFHIAGDHGRYTVVVGAHVAMCSCPATAHCSHLDAALSWVNAGDAERVLMQEALELRRERDRHAASTFGMTGVQYGRSLCAQT